MEFAKGHGTENDFVLLSDLDGAVDLIPARVAVLCDRRRGLGADGVLRVARAGALADRGVLTELPGGVAADDWFMDYRNADGSIAEMCGNGVRVFAHYLRASGLESRSEFVVGSRAGARPVIVHSADNVDADVSVNMGPARLLGRSVAVISGRRFAGVAVDVGNPHLACIDDTLSPAALAALDLSGLPTVDPELFPHGVNVELTSAPIAVREDLTAVEMRVVERGVGETRSCGTGIAATAAAVLDAAGRDHGTVVVRVPGGEARVTIDGGTAHLRGPSVLMAAGTVSQQWWARLGE